MNTCEQCRRPAKFEFEGHGRRVARCAKHAYPWLSSSDAMPEWVEAVYLRGQRTAWGRAEA